MWCAAAEAAWARATDVMADRRVLRAIPIDPGADHRRVRAGADLAGLLAPRHLCARDGDAAGRDAPGGAQSSAPSACSPSAGSRFDLLFYSSRRRSALHRLPADSGRLRERSSAVTPRLLRRCRLVGQQPGEHPARVAASSSVIREVNSRSMPAMCTTAALRSAARPDLVILTSTPRPSWDRAAARPGPPPPSAPPCGTDPAGRAGPCPPDHAAAADPRSRRAGPGRRRC